MIWKVTATFTLDADTSDEAETAAWDALALREGFGDVTIEDVEEEE